jgi:Holliday junction resolvase RusA-like endonuclease
VIALSFRVFGEAVAKGSMKTFAYHVKGADGQPLYQNGKAVLRSVATHDNPKTRDWQTLVRKAASDCISATRNDDRESGRSKAWRLLDGPVRLSVAFYLPRPKSLPKKVVANTKGYDTDKLARLILDALQGVAYANDAAVVELIAGKYYAGPSEPAHVDVRVEPTAGLRPAEWPAAPAPLFQEPLFAEGR